MAGVIDLPEPTFVPPTPPPWLELVDVWVAKVDKRQCNVVVSAVPESRNRRRAFPTADPPHPPPPPAQLKEACSQIPLDRIPHVKRVQRVAPEAG